MRWRAASGETRKVLARLLPAYVVGGFSLLLYACCAESSPLSLDLSDDALVILKLTFFLLLLSIGACRGGVDRTPPRQDIGLPEAPALPDELLSLDAGVRPELAALKLPELEGCVRQTPEKPDRWAWRCTRKTALAAPPGWRQVPGLAMWLKDGLSLVQTWHRAGAAWVLTQSLHPSKGDQASASDASSSPSSKGPQ